MKRGVQKRSDIQAELGGLSLKIANRLNIASLERGRRETDDNSAFTNQTRYRSAKEKRCLEG